MKQTIGLKAKVNIKKTDENVLNAVWNGFASGLLICGLIILSGQMLPTADKITVSVVALALSVFSYLLSYITKKAFMLYLLPACASMLVLLSAPTRVANGAISLYNCIVEATGKKQGKIVTALEQISSTNDKDTLFLLLFFVSVMLLLLAIAKKSGFSIFPIIITSAAFVFFSYLGCVSGIAFAVTVAGIVIEYFALHSMSVKNLKSVCIRVSALICCLAVLACSSFASGEWYFLEFAGEHISGFTDDLRYGKGNILPEGDFSKIKAFEPSDEIQLEVVMSTPESYYLRGYVGEVYNGKGWEALDKSRLYGYSDLFYWLHKSDFYGQTQLSDAAAVTQQTEEQNRIIIHNTGASKKYLYTPYEATGINDLSFDTLIGDKIFSSGRFNGNKVYTVTADMNQVKKYTSVAAELYEKEKSGDIKALEYLENEAHYNSFVYESYLDIPDEMTNLFEGMLGKVENTATHMEYGDAKQKILSFLTSEMTYSIEVKVSEGDFTESFLQISKEGYSVHFASAATLMFRYLGIPARYVEGYLITPEDVEGIVADSVIKVKETNVHAWTEFYQDGVGWIPFEVTPPYLDVMEKADDLMEVDSQNGNSQSTDNQHNEEKYKNDNENADGEHQSEHQRNRRTGFIILIVVFFSALLMLLFALLIIAFNNRKRLMMLKKIFASSDNRKAVLSMFDYAVSFILNEKLTDNEIYLSAENKSVKDALVVYQKARFSVHKINDQEKEIVTRFKNEALEEYIQTSSKAQRFADKYIKYRY